MGQHNTTPALGADAREVRRTTAPAPREQSPGAQATADDREARRIRHWRSWLLAMFREHFQFDPATLAIKKIRWTEWAQEVGVSDQLLRNWYDLGAQPSPEMVMRLARHLDVLPQAILYHCGRITLDDLATYVGPQPLDLIDEDEYQQAVAALQYTADEREREWERRHLEASLEHTRRLKTLLQMRSHEGWAQEEWLALRDELRSPMGLARLRAQTDGPAASRALEAASAPGAQPTSYYLPAEFVSGGADAEGAADARRLDLTPPISRRARRDRDRDRDRTPTARQQPERHQRIGRTARQQNNAKAAPRADRAPRAPKRSR